MRLTLGSRTYDLATRALVLGTGERAADQGADLVELPPPGGAPPSQSPPPVPLFAVVADDASLARALSAGAELVRLLHPTAAGYGTCAAGGVAVVVPAGRTAEAEAAGLAADRVVSDALFLDVTATPCPLAATVVGVLRGARLVRTDEVRVARRVCDVLAAIAGAAPR
jgi:hypothetical protein